MRGVLGSCSSTYSTGGTAAASSSANRKEKASSQGWRRIHERRGRTAEAAALSAMVIGRFSDRAEDHVTEPRRAPL